MQQLFLVLLLLAPIGCMTPTAQQVASGECQVGKPHGKYELRVVGGPTVIQGHFAKGKKHGLFVAYTTGLTKVAEISYKHGRMSGPVRLWYGEFVFPEAAGRLKLEAGYANGKILWRRSWWSSGTRRLDETYEGGAVDTIAAWDESGQRLSRAHALSLSAESLSADQKFYDVVESEVRAYRPPCSAPAA